MFMLVTMRCSLLVVMMPVIMIVRVSLLMRMIVLLDMHIELRPGNVRALLARNMEVIFVEAQLREFALELFEVHAEVQQRADEHVAADAAEDVEVECFHRKRD